MTGSHPAVTLGTWINRECDASLSKRVSARLSSKSLDCFSAKKFLQESSFDIRQTNKDKAHGGVCKTFIHMKVQQGSIKLEVVAKENRYALAILLNAGDHRRNILHRAIGVLQKGMQGSCVFADPGRLTGFNQWG